MIFGIASEGATDQAVIENILCGFFENLDLDEEISFLQPPLDLTSLKQADFGGWELLIKYINSTRFKEDVLNCEYIIFHLDSDITFTEKFPVSYVDENNVELSASDLVAKIKKQLTEIMRDYDSDFFQKNSDKVIFSIAVHSIECWLLTYLSGAESTKIKTKNCANSLFAFLRKSKGLCKNFQIKKEFRLYDHLSRNFRRKKVIDELKANETSFRLFIEELSLASIA